MSKERSKHVRIYCEVDGNSLDVYSGKSGFTLIIGDDDNDQSRQVNLSREDLALLRSMIESHLKNNH